MQIEALDGIRVVDVSGTVATSYCAKLFADYGADVINLEPDDGFPTRQLPPFIPARTSADGKGIKSDIPADAEYSAMHAYLHTNKRSLLARDLAQASISSLLTSADLVLDDGHVEGMAEQSQTGVRSSILWFGKGGAYEDYVGTDGQIFALNGMLRGIGRVEGPPLIPTGYQAQVIGGVSAFIGSLTQVLAGELGNRTAPVQLETSILDACLCLTDVGAISFYNTGLQAPRLGVNRFPPTYPLGVFPCKDGWLGVTVLTPSQWHAFCDLLDMKDLADLPVFQTAIGRMEATDLLEPIFSEKLLQHSAEDLFYRGQEATIPLARVPTMEELFGVDQFLHRKAFSDATLHDGRSIQVPSVPFRLFQTPPKFGGPVAALGEHTGAFG